MGELGQAPTEPTAAILITNYNTWSLTERCVQNCYRQDASHFKRVLVYDDCSTQDFAGCFPEGTILYRGSANVGLAKALNIAFRMITEDVVVLYDTDAYPISPVCKEVKEMFARNPSLGLVGLPTVGSRGTRTESYTSEPNIWTILLGQALYARAQKWLKDKSGRLSIIAGAMAVRRAAFEEIGGFDENFDFLDVDFDFSMRMNRSRWKVALAEQARVFHEGGGTAHLTRHRVLRFYKNRWYLLTKFDRVPARPLVKALIVARLCAEYALLKVLGRRLFHDREVREDKIEGRRSLIRFCLDNF